MTAAGASRWVFLVMIFAVFLMVSAGCGDDDDSSEDSGQAPVDENDDDDMDDDAVSDDDDNDSADDDDDAGDDDDDDDNDDNNDDSSPSTEDCEPYDYDTTPTIVRGPYLQHVTQTTIRILWQTDTPANSILRFGTGPELGFYQCELNKTYDHEVEVLFLDPETSYTYLVRSDGAQSDPSEFTTAPLRDTPFSFAVYGDSRSIPTDHQWVAEGIDAASPDFVFNVGDVVGDGHIFEQFDEHHFEPAKNLMAHTPMYVSIGNHEGESPHFYRLFSFPDPEKYYTFDYGNARFISLNTNRLYLQASPQYVWFESELQRANDDGVEWIFVFAHHPAWTEGWDSPGYTGEILMRLSLVPLMEQYGVDVFFCGHTHDYERGLKNGVYHIITGGGGASLDTFQQDFDHITVYESRKHFVKGEIIGNHASFYATDPDGTIFDSWEINH